MLIALNLQGKLLIISAYTLLYPYIPRESKSGVKFLAIYANFTQKNSPPHTNECSFVWGEYSVSCRRSPDHHQSYDWHPADQRSNFFCLWERLLPCVRTSYICGGICPSTSFCHSLGNFSFF